jgi:hypothetical protein
MTFYRVGEGKAGRHRGHGWPVVVGIQNQWLQREKGGGELMGRRNDGGTEVARGGSATRGEPKEGEGLEWADLVRKA